MKKGKKPAAPVSTPTSLASTPAPSTTEPPMAFQYEGMMALDETLSPHNQSGSASAAGPSVPSSSQRQGRVKRKKSIKSETSIELKGPMEVDGSVKSSAGVTFSGDFAVRDRIEAYGNIDVNGNLTCSNKIKSFGNVKINGSGVCRDKVKIFGKLHITGTFEAQSAIEVWGAVTINGYMKCKSLTAYGSLTTVGDQSWYEVEEEETVWGAKLIQREDFQG